MKLLLFLFLPFAAFSQNTFDVFLEVLPDQQFQLVNDSLFPPGIWLKASGNISLKDSSIHHADVSLLDSSGINLHSSVIEVSVHNFNEGALSLTIPLGQYTALNQFSASAVLKDRSGLVVQTIIYSSGQ